jgi:hypothetical protein
MTPSSLALQHRFSNLPFDPPWSREFVDSFGGNIAEDHPQLFDAMHLISVRASYALSVACAEWVAARLEGHIDTADSWRRIEASWAATVDWRYASLPKPQAPTRAESTPLVDARWLLDRTLTMGLDFYVKTWRAVANKGVRNCALRQALLARQVVDRHAPFDDWLAASMRRAHQLFPASDVPIEQESFVPRQAFDASSAWNEQASEEARLQLVASLGPAANPYLRPEVDMQADGFEGPAYPALG